MNGARAYFQSSNMNFFIGQNLIILHLLGGNIKKFYRFLLPYIFEQSWQQQLKWSVGN